MMRFKSKVSATVAGIALVGCAVAGLTIAASQTAYAQAADANAEKPISLNFQNAPIGSVLKSLFGSVGANYSIDSDVSGSVNITMNNVGFLAALRSLLHANNPPLTYDFTDGVYHIRVRKTDTGALNANNPVPVNSGTDTTLDSTPNATGGDKRYYKLPVDHYDVAMLLRYLSGGKGIFVVPSTGASTGGAGGGAGGGGRGGVPTTSGTGTGLGGAGISGGMGSGGGMGMSGGMSGGMGGMGGGAAGGFGY